MNVIEIACTFGTDLSSRHSGAHLRNVIVNSTKQESDCVILDFAHVLSLSESFADESIGLLVAQNGKAWFRDHVKLEHVDETVRQSVLRSVLYRLDGLPV